MAQERKPKRQRFSLGGPSGDTSFEDYLTGSHKNITSDEEEHDQENQDPEGEFDEEEEEEEDHGEEEEEEGEEYYDEEEENNDHYLELEDPGLDPLDPAPNPSTQDTINNIHNSQNSTRSSSAENIFYLFQVRLILPTAQVPVTRLLHLPATTLFEQFSEAIFAAFEWSGGHLWKFNLEKPPSKPLNANALPDQRREITNIKDVQGLHNLGTFDLGRDLDSQKIRLMDVWGAHQVPVVRALNVFYTYDCYGDAWFHRITFMGVAERGLAPEDMGVEVKKGQRILCFGGSGAAWPEDVADEESQERWEEETNMHEWSIREVNKQLSEIPIKTV